MAQHSLSLFGYMAPVIAELRAAGATSLRTIAAGLMSAVFQRHAVAHGLQRRLCACWRGSSSFTAMMPAMAFYDSAAQRWLPLHDREIGRLL
jgi:hypothetical protein